MTYWNLIRDNLKLTDEEIKCIKDDIEIIQKTVDKYKIKFDKPFDIAFYNHIISAVKRIQTGNFVEEISKDTVSELSPKSVEISDEILDNVFKKYNRHKNMSEIYLVAIYVDMFLKNKL